MDISKPSIPLILLTVASAFQATSIITKHWLDMTLDTEELNAGFFEMSSKYGDVPFSDEYSPIDGIPDGLRATQGLTITGMVFLVVALMLSLLTMFVGEYRKSSRVSFIVGIFSVIAGSLTIIGFFYPVGTIEYNSYAHGFSAEIRTGYSAYFACFSGVLGVMAGGIAFVISWRLKNESQDDHHPLVLIARRLSKNGLSLLKYLLQEVVKFCLKIYQKMAINQKLKLSIPPVLLTVASAFLATSLATRHWLEMAVGLGHLHAGLFAACSADRCDTYSDPEIMIPLIERPGGFKTIRVLIITGLVFFVLALMFSLLTCVGKCRKSSYISFIVGIFSVIAGSLAFTASFYRVGTLTSYYYTELIDVENSFQAGNGYSAYLACFSGVLGILAGGAACLIGWQMKDKSPTQNYQVMDIDQRLKGSIPPILLTVASAFLATSIATRHWLEMTISSDHLHSGLYTVCSPDRCHPYSDPGTSTSLIIKPGALVTIGALIITGLVFFVLALMFSLLTCVGKCRKSSYISFIVGIFSVIAGSLALTGYFCPVGTITSNYYQEYYQHIGTYDDATSSQIENGYSAHFAGFSGVLGILAGGAAFLIGWQLKVESPTQNYQVMKSSTEYPTKNDPIAVVTPVVLHNQTTTTKSSLPSFLWLQKPTYL